MAIALTTNFKLLKRLPLDIRDQFDTLEEMKSYPERFLPEVFRTVCVDTGRSYIYNKLNPIDPVLGRWRDEIAIVKDEIGQTQRISDSEIKTLFR